ncbi:hypothetical protein OG548_45740 [Streptomyces sp. NBC_01356]|uniref:hypothetical protein n=1 Tax=Streptomyces sp. NBC_01356 TaxID=2903836 RepID=UPI002E36903C|nr:hypothetical protein [Streptomyces sp. NBC_01356]
MDYSTQIDVQVLGPDQETDPWQAYENAAEPLFSQVPPGWRGYHDGLSGLTLHEQAAQDLQETLFPLIDAQYLSRLAHYQRIDLRIRAFDHRAGSPDPEPVLVHTPAPADTARAYLAAAARGYDQIRKDLRHRILEAHLTGMTADDLATTLAGRISADEIHHLLAAHRLATAARTVISTCTRLAPRTDVVIGDDNTVEVFLHPSEDQDMAYEDMCRSEGNEAWLEGDWWGYAEATRDGTELHTLLAQHYTLTHQGKPSTPTALTPAATTSGHIQITLPPRTTAQPATPPS